MTTKSNPVAAGLKLRLEAAIEKSGLGKREVAKKAGLNETYVYDILSGKVTSPRYDKVKSLTDVLGVTPEHLFNGVPLSHLFNKSLCEEVDRNGNGDQPHEENISSTPHMTSPKFIIDGNVVHIDACLDRKGVARLKTQLDDILHLMEP